MDRNSGYITLQGNPSHLASGAVERRSSTSLREAPKTPQQQGATAGQGSQPGLLPSLGYEHGRERIHPPIQQYKALCLKPQGARAEEVAAAPTDRAYSPEAKSTPQQHLCTLETLTSELCSTTDRWPPSGIPYLNRACTQEGGVYFLGSSGKQRGS